MYLSHPVVVGETLYGFSTKAAGAALRAGHARWAHPLARAARQATNVAVTKAGSLLLLLEDDGELVVAWANKNAFDPVKTVHGGEGRHLGPANRVGPADFIRDANTLTMWTLE